MLANRKLPRGGLRLIVVHAVVGSSPIAHPLEKWPVCSRVIHAPAGRSRCEVLVLTTRSAIRGQRRSAHRWRAPRCRRSGAVAGLRRSAIV